MNEKIISEGGYKYTRVIDGFNKYSSRLRSRLSQQWVVSTGVNLMYLQRHGDGLPPIVQLQSRQKRVSDNRCALGEIVDPSRNPQAPKSF